jgi:serine/threonine-protein kinase
MNQPMRSLLKCSQCGAMLPPGTTVCPRDGARAITDNPFTDEPTVRRDSLSPRTSGKTAALGTPQQQPPAAPARVEPEYDDEEPQQVEVSKWEETVSRDVLVGKQIGDFVVKRRVGAGGMGIVYEGEHPIIGRKVAIKILRPEFSEGHGARDLIAEARAASAIRHRGIIDIFGFGTIPHIGQYMVMEYLEGTPLDEVIAQRAPMLELEVIALLDELLGALGAAHSAGVIHRDLKPGNIFVISDSTGNESVKVLDFGLAKRSEVPNGTSPQTRASMIVGTPEYMAPEQATGNAVGPHTDLYSVGVIAFEMLTRRMPFLGPTAMAIAIQHVQARPPAPSEFVDLHPELDGLVLRLLSKTAAQRPASAEAVRRELKAIARQISDGATRLDPAPRGEKPSDEVPKVDADYLGAPISGSIRSGSDSLTGTRTAPAGSGGPAGVSGSRPRVTPVPTLDQAAHREGGYPDTMELETVSGRGQVPATERVAPVRSNRTLQLMVGGVLLLALGALGFWALRPEDPIPSNPTRVEPVTPTPPIAEVKPVTPPTPDPVAPVTPDPSLTKSPEDTSPAQSGQPQVPPPNGQKKPGERTVTPQPGRPNPPRTKKMGTLRLASKFWADIFVDGKSMGQLPRNNDLELPVGKHALELRNPGFKPYRATIIIIADEMTDHQVIWEKAGTSTEGP